MGSVRQVSSAVLKNRGVPVEVHRTTVSDEGRIVRVFTATDEPVFDEVYVQFTNLVLSDLEDHYGSLDDWQKALTSKPFATVTTTMGLVLDEPRRKVGVSLKDGDVDQYATAIGAAFMLANGAPPEAAAKVLASGIKASEKARQDLEASMAEVAEDVEQTESTPGTTGSAPGSGLAAA